MFSSAPARTASLLLGLATLLLGTARAEAQYTAEPIFSRPVLRPLPEIGSTVEDRLRVAQLLGNAPTSGFLIRTASTLAPPIQPGTAALFSLEILQPSIRAVWNSDIPFSLNEGAMWAGRGLNTRLSGGVRVGGGPVTITLAPQLIHHQNREFDYIDNPWPGRSPFASPWHTWPESLDLPTRFGAQPFTVVDWGQSSFSVGLGPLALGLSTEDQWWGPGARNAIVMSNNAPGIPHLFLRTSAPLQTQIGSIEARWIAGTLRESDYFDNDSTNNYRSIAGLVGTFSPALEPNLTLGAARVVYAPSSRPGFSPVGLLDVFRAVGRPNNRPATDLTRNPGPDQIFSLFGRWVFPEAGVEAYGEWARTELPASLRDLLTAPNHTQGYTAGFLWAREVGGGTVRVHSEFTSLEQSTTYRQQRVVTYYTSRPVPQGYTHHGQVIGAAIGPGSSSQWGAVGYIAPEWSVRVSGGRIRWENDTYYNTQAPYPFGHDVSMYGGVQAGFRHPWAHVTAEVITSRRLNYLFQNYMESFEDRNSVDVWNHSLRFNIMPGHLFHR